MSGSPQRLPLSLMVSKSPSRDGDESFLSDITGVTDDHHRVVATTLLSGSNFFSEDAEDGTEASIYPSVIDDGDTAFISAAEAQAEDHAKLKPATSFDMPSILEENESIEVTRDGKSHASIAINFLEDKKSDMTLGRRIALALMSYKWYWNPPSVTFQDTEPVGASYRDNKEHVSAIEMEAYPFSHSRRENPSLQKAWAYFEHVALPRYIVQPKTSAPTHNPCLRILHKFNKGNKQLQRAEPGEKNLPTKLYEPIFTPHKQLGDFGLGIGLYFSTLRAITILTLLAGLLNIPNLMYFSSPEYSLNQLDVANLLKGSAICSNTAWVPCPDCDPANYEPERFATGSDPSKNYTIQLALRNDCDGATLQEGLVNYATLIFILLGTVAINLYLKRMEIVMDEDEQTAQDYSIVIENPPGDATDPKEWRNFFRDNFGAQVTACTVAVDNDLLVRSLVERREILRRIEMMLEPGTSLDRLTLAGRAAKEERERKFLRRWLALFVSGIPELFARLVVLTAKVQGLAQQDYPSTNVFVTFETETDQRHVLKELSVGTLRVSRNKKTALKNPKYLFRGERVLAVKEPDEPNTIRWQDLNEKLKDRIKQQVLTLLATIAAIALIAFIIRLCNDASVTASAFAIAISNSLFPMFAKFLNSLEAHSSEGGKQRSLYCKIALFRWVNTAIVLTIITPFSATLANSEGLIQKVYALFFAEIVTTNAIQFADPVGHLNRHFFAPRAKTQDSMNLKFSGAEFELAERYTNMTKILFLALWYCAIFPGALFMCAFALFINYFTDRFSLMRTWKRQPHLGTTISGVSRHWFFPLAMIAMAIMSSYFWSAFPFDNLCQSDAAVGSSYAGSWTVRPLSGGSLADPVVIEATDPSFNYCLQDFFRTDGRSFPFIPAFQPDGAEWMTPQQETVTTVYGWSAIGVIALIILSFIRHILSGIISLFRSTYKPTGETQGINFSDVASISCYVPQVESKVFSYPLLAANVDGIDMDLLEWTDPDRPHAFYDLTKDAEVLLRGMDVSSKTVFSQIAHWKPKESN